MGKIIDKLNNSVSLMVVASLFMYPGLAAIANIFSGDVNGSAGCRFEIGSLKVEGTLRTGGTTEAGDFQPFGKYEIPDQTANVL